MKIDSHFLNEILRGPGEREDGGYVDGGVREKKGRVSTDEGQQLLVALR